MANENRYYSGQGRAYVADRDANGKPADGFRWVGNVPTLSIGLETTKFEHNESHTGNRAIDLTIIQQLSGTLNITFESISADNWALAFFGSKAVVTGAAVTDEVVAASATGIRYALANVNLDDSVPLTAEDSQAGPLTEGTDFEVDYPNGVITLLSGYSGNGLPDDISVDYTFKDHFNLEAFAEVRIEKWLRFEGLNTARAADNEVIVEVFKAEFDPASTYDLINDEIAELAVEARLLYDELNADGNGFFRERRTEATA